MRDFKGYEIVKVSGSIKEDKLKKAVRNGKITLNADELKGNKPWLVHPMCAKMITKAQSKGRGVTSMMLGASDFIYDLDHHGDKSMWKWVNDMTKKKAYNWIWGDDQK
jgi:hypothetical protein